MAEKSIAKEALEKLNNKLECTICLTDYTDPKLLPCFHVFCQKCLQPLVIQDRDGLSLQCPICRHSTKLPPKGVAGLQSDFHVEHLFEIRDAFEKTNLSMVQKTTCEQCEVEAATGFCHDCNEYICDACTSVHNKLEKLQSHEIVPYDEVHKKASNFTEPKKRVSYCPTHQGNDLKIFCETCSELICVECTIKLHQGHNYDLVSDVSSKHKHEIVDSLEPVKEQLSTVAEAIIAIDDRTKEIEEQKMTIEDEIRNEFHSLQALLEERQTELICKLDHIAQLKLKGLATQRDEVEQVHIKLSSCVDYVERSLKTSAEEDSIILAMKAPVMKRIEQITANFKTESLPPKEEANLELIATNKQDLRQACKEFGDIQIDLPVVCPEKSYARGEGLKKATVGEQEVVVVTTMSTTNKEFTHHTEVNVTAELVHCRSKSIESSEVQFQQNSQHRITYCPTKRGEHQLSLKINGSEMKDSPFTIAVTSPLQAFRQPVRVIRNLKESLFVTRNSSRSEIIVTESISGCVSVFSPNGTKIRSFGTKGRKPGQFLCPRGVAVDRVGNIYVADRDNHRIQKFSSNGQFVKSTGTHGKGRLQFSHPLSVVFNSKNNKLYVCEHSNHRVQILNTDLTFDSIIGRAGKENGEFNFVKDIAINSKGDLYITDHYNHRVQIFNGYGGFVRTLSKKQHGETLQYPYGIAIDSNDTVYVSEERKCCVAMFEAGGEYLGTFGSKGKGEGQFDAPFGLHIDHNDMVYVCDGWNGRIHMF